MNAPRSTTPSTNPIQPYVDQAVRRIRRYFEATTKSGEALVIGVFGEWGCGKSYLLKQVSEQFPNEPKPLQATADLRTVTAEQQTLTIEFNPWRYEREAHLLVPLLKTTRQTLEKFVADSAPVRAQTHNPLQKLLARVLKKTDEKPVSWLFDRLVLLGNVTIAASKIIEIKASVPGLGEVKFDPAGALKAAQEQVDYAEKKISCRKKQQPVDYDSLYYDLHKALEKVTRGSASKGPRLNFLFLIDDIDRCLPDKAVEMLESIKLFLDVPGCAFILAIDDEVVERGIAHRYRDYMHDQDHGAHSIAYALKPGRYEEYRSRHGQGRLPPITGHEYLEKIVQLPLRLPRWNAQQVRNFLIEKYPELFASPSPTSSSKSQENHAASGAQPQPAANLLVQLFLLAIPPAPRKLIRAAELLQFMRELASARGLQLQDYTLAQLVILQLFAPQCFRFLRHGRYQAWHALWYRLNGYSGIMNTPDAHLSESFFGWWQEICGHEKETNPGDLTYLERKEIPFIDEVRQAARNRNGFDPRQLFLFDAEAKVDDQLEAYFSLFAPPLETVPATGDERPVAAPVDRPAFVSLLLGDTRRSWLSALESESVLQGCVLDDATFAAILAGLRGRTALPNNDWLELLMPLLSSAQIKRLYRDTDYLPRLAETAQLPFASHRA